MSVKTGTTFTFEYYLTARSACQSFSSSSAVFPVASFQNVASSNACARIAALALMTVPGWLRSTKSRKDAVTRNEPL